MRELQFAHVNFGTRGRFSSGNQDHAIHIRQDCHDIVGRQHGRQIENDDVRLELLLEPFQGLAGFGTLQKLRCKANAGRGVE